MKYRGSHKLDFEVCADIAQTGASVWEASLKLRLAKLEPLIRINLIF